MRAKYILSEVMVGLWRNVTMTVAMIITMAVSLTMLGASLILYQQIDSMKGYYFDKVQVSIFLRDDISTQQRDDLAGQLQADPLIKQPVIHETKEQAWNKFQQQFKDAPDLIAATKKDALPESYRIQLKNPKQYNQVAAEYKGKAGIDEIVDQSTLLSKVFGVLGAAQNLALVIALVQGLAALLLVGNTIQVAAYSRRREVAVMKLVGASNWFIQSPFVLEAMFAGIIGAIIASAAMVVGKIFLIDGSLKSLASLLTPAPWSRIYIMIPILLGIGAVISGVTGWVTLRFYIKK
ncbi:permease-like cell division protein FtsX [Rugosimonospora africana]|uniref:Cell division protein FtsX n=1 Tax=Rugosimonospora africana TaxID=556532 RepID=A0A8J3VNG4_9ACTN|nr:permease-like cell division protein FtsX [Rugosimonospora africana]GIH12792.1 cell division protein FtsX [Rugosimonospora africana]